VKIRDAGFALRVVRRRDGDAAIVYRRALDAKHEERFTRLAAIGPLAFTAGTPLLREAVRATSGARAKLCTGPFHPLDPDAGARVACYALVSRGLRSASGLSRAAENLRRLDSAEAAWWLGRMMNGTGVRVARALRILVEAVQ